MHWQLGSGHSTSFWNEPWHNMDIVLASKVIEWAIIPNPTVSMADMAPYGLHLRDTPCWRAFVNGKIQIRSAYLSRMGVQIGPIDPIWKLIDEEEFFHLPIKDWVYANLTNDGWFAINGMYHAGFGHRYGQFLVGADALEHDTLVEEIQCRVALVQYILEIVDKSWSVKFEHVYREDNQLAGFLVRACPQEDLLCHRLLSPPTACLRIFQENCFR
ncbi:hypothetical protein V6N12_014361 [Hibiscus sabdariffa]|uniref:RNase H type-1 domain-containing protein n=1 Tax=Hibiscus sabdariffa TaxID=183260 RepID=A0ABR2DKC1_9ROSI